MIRIHAVPSDQLWALMRLERDNQGFDELTEKPKLSLIEGQVRTGLASRLKNDVVANRLRVVRP